MKKNIDASILHRKIDLLTEELYSEVSNYLDTILSKSGSSELTMDDTIETQLASEKTLAKDWLSEHEEEVWKDL